MLLLQTTLWEEQPFHQLSGSAKVVSTGQKRETACGVAYVPPQINTDGQGTNVLSTVWGCVLNLASECTTPNHSFETNPTLEEADHTQP